MDVHGKDKQPNKIKKATSQTVKVFKIYIVSLILLYVASTILSSQNVIDVEPNSILLGSAVVIGIIIVAHQAYMAIVVRQEKKKISQ